MALVRLNEQKEEALKKRRERPPGHYWCREKGGSWYIAEWDGSHWWVFGVERRVSEPHEVREPRIKSPDEEPTEALATIRELAPAFFPYKNPDDDPVPLRRRLHDAVLDLLASTPPVA